MHDSRSQASGMRFAQRLVAIWYILLGNVIGGLWIREGVTESESVGSKSVSPGNFRCSILCPLTCRISITSASRPWCGFRLSI